MELKFEAIRIALFIHIIGIAMWFGGAAACAGVSAQLRRATTWPARLAIRKGLGSIAFCALLPGILLAAPTGIFLIVKRPAGMEPWIHGKLGFFMIALLATVAAIAFDRGSIRAALETAAAASEGDSGGDESEFRSAHKRYTIASIIASLSLAGALFFVIFGK